MMRKRFRFWIVVETLIGQFILTAQCTAEAKKTEEIVSLKNGRISITAEQESLKDVLEEVGRKTGIRIVIHDGVPDRNVSVKLSSIPASDITSILKALSVKNYAAGFDNSLKVVAVHIVPDGKRAAGSLKSIVPDLVPIRHARFVSATETTTIKGNAIAEMPATKDGVPARYVKNEVILKFKNGTTLEEMDELLKKHDLTSIEDKELADLGYTKAIISDSRDAAEVIREIVRNSNLVNVSEPNGIASTLTVSDPLYPYQHYIPMTQFDGAWKLLKRKSAVTVAVIDSGVDAGHPDLKGKVSEGYNAIVNSRNTGDNNGHGTFIAGIIAAAADKTGIRGLYENAVVIPVKVLDADGIGTYEDVAKGIVWSANHGARVINLSLGGTLYSALLGDAVSYALEKGCILVAAGGNDGAEQVVYPAAYPDVIGVAAINDDGTAWAESNRGPHIAVAAPGVEILSLGPDNGYVYGTGTSASTAMVSALAAILSSEKPDISNINVRRLIMQTARDLGEKGSDNVFGAGEIDAMKALSQRVNAFHDVAVQRRRR